MNSRRPFPNLPTLAAAALLAALAPASAQTPVPIANAGFENPVLSEGNYIESISGWSVVAAGDIGVWNVEIADYPAQAPEGANVAYVYNATGLEGCSQVLSGVIGKLQVNANYTLTVKVGDALTYAFPGYKVQLLADGTVLAEDDNTLAPITNGTFATSTVTYTYDAGLHSALVGKPLEIRLLSKGLIAGEVEFDDVKLDATFTEPVASPGGPYSVLSIDSLPLDGSASVPSEGQTITAYDWDINNDGFFGEVTGATPSAISYATLTGSYGMSPGANSINLRVTDSAGKTSTATTTVTLVPASSDAYLSGLQTTPHMDLTPAFFSGGFTYAATVPFGTTSMTVTPTKADPGATIGLSLDGLVYAPINSNSPSPSITLADAGIGKVIYLKVTAEDTTTTLTYTLTVTRQAPSTNANLADLVTTPATTLTPTFVPSTLEYTASVLYPNTTITVTPTAEDSLATIKVNGNTVASGTESGTITLNPGSNVINTVVTAEDATTKTYKLTITVAVADPVAIPGGPYAVSFGGGLGLNGSASLPSDGHTITTYDWDLDNDGDFADNPITGATPASISYPDLQSVHGMTVGANPIKLRVTDSSLKTSTVEGTVTINPPVSIFTSGTVQPVFDGADQGYFNSPLPSTDGSPGDKWFAEISGAGQTKGQTFTVTGDRLLKGITYRLGNTKAEPTKVYVVRVGAVDTATNAFYPLFSEEITQTVSWGATGVTDSYGTWTFATQRKLPGLPAGTVYGFDIAMKSSTTAWQTGIPYPTYKNSNVFAGGFKYTCAQTGTQGSATNTVQPDSTRDREFHLDMDAITITDTTAPTLVSVGDNVSGGPIHEDQVQVIYTLTFDEAIDASTIDLADFENLGSGVSIDSVVSVQNTTPYPTASVIKVVMGISGTGTLKLGIKPGSNIADIAGNPVVSPVADDTTIERNTGTNPGTGNRWWDLATSGITDGASQGGTGTWNTTTTNWDRGFGFSAPVAWNNSNNDNAIFGGTAGTVTLDGDLSLAGLTVSLPTGSGSGYSIGNVGETNILTFTGAKLVTTTATGTGTNQDVTIRAGIAGSPTMNITGRATNSVDNFSLLPGSDVTQTIGTLNMLNTFASNKRLILGGDSTGNVVDTLTWSVTNNQLMLTKAGPGGWTITNDFASSTNRASRLYIERGTLTLGGTNNSTTHKVGVATNRESTFTASNQDSKLIAKGTFTINDNREYFYVQNKGTLAPGPGVATLTVKWNTNSAGTHGQFNMQTGSIYEWDVAGSTSTDVINVQRGGSPSGSLTLGAMTIKVNPAGITTPIAAGDQLTVFTYQTGVTRSIGTVTIDTSALGAGWSGTPTLADNGTDKIYISGLTFTPPSSSPFATWAGPGVAFDADANNDGVDNGMAWLLGAANPSDNALDKLPKATRNGATLRLTFRCLKSTKRGGAVLKVQSSGNLGLTDPWTSHEAAVPDDDGTVNGVVFDTTADGDYINVIADIPAPGSGLFARLGAVNAP